MQETNYGLFYVVISDTAMPPNGSSAEMHHETRRNKPYRWLLISGDKQQPRPYLVRDVFPGVVYALLGVLLGTLLLPGYD